MIGLLTRLAKRVWRYRSNITGRWVTREYADAHKATTTKEKVS